MDSENRTALPADADLALLSQYLDGELPAVQSRELESRLHADPVLQSALLRMQELNHRLHDVLAEGDAIPDAVVELLDNPRQDESTPDNVLPFPGTARSGQRSKRIPRVFAVAASFAAAAAVLFVTDLNRSPEPVLPGNDALVSTALDRYQSASGWHALGDGRELQPVLTFAHEDGRWCREYLLRGADTDWRAVACRTGDQWQTQAAGLEAYLEASNAYRPAGAADAAPVAVFINKHAADIALGRVEEDRLIASGWRAP